MDPALTSFVPNGVALLLGGLVASVGPGVWARRPRGSARLIELSRAHWWATVCLMTVLPGLLAWMTVRSMASLDAPTLVDVSLAKMFVLGIAIGMPMAIPTLVATRRAGRQRRASLERWAERPALEADRQSFAHDLADMMGEVAPDPATVTARATGNEGRVLTLVGEIDPRGGEVLTEALRDDLRAIGFERVEGTHRNQAWWTRV